MFAITSKVKIAAGIAAGALTLGAAGAYAATANNNGTISVSTLHNVDLGTNAGTLTLKSTNGNTTSLTIPATFQNQGQCVSLFAQHQDLVLAPTTGTARISKNAHGKLMSSSTIKAWCQARLTSTKAKTDSADTETPDATQSSAPETDSTDSTDSSAPHGHGHAYGHSKHAAN
jgi:virulence-associated protein VagC